MDSRAIEVAAMQRRLNNASILVSQVGDDFDENSNISIVNKIGPGSK